MQSDGGSRSGTMSDGAEAIAGGRMSINRQGLVIACDATARRLLGLPEELAGRQFHISEIDLHLPSLSVSPEGEASATITRVGAPEIEIRASHRGSDCLELELTERCQAGPGDTLPGQAEALYRSLFENSVYGIYRDTMDGIPVRGNPALAALNGYATEAEYLASVTLSGGNWYVDPGRVKEFRRLIDSDGRVKDLVSEVYRHRSRERFWITENAWIVRDSAGKPMFIEGTIQDATDRVKGLEAIERQANTDALTGAASRFRFLNHLNSETRPEKAACVLFTIDLDHFKEVNDMLGHGAGDIVLKTVATRLQSIGGPNCMVARLGGDEFALLQSGAHSHMTADTVAQAIVKALRQPIAIEGHNVIAGCSVGVAVYPAHADNAEELLTNADLALYEVKSRGRNNFRIFGADLKNSLLRRKSLEGELKEAIAGGQLELYYQPIVEAVGNKTVGYEALMRWHHPRLGFLPPSQFIPIAEDAGLMGDLGNWAITRACRQAALLPGGLSVAVNVSPNQFRSAGIVSEVRKALTETGMAPSRLILEVTESVILSSETIASTVFGQLQELGVQLSLDDFGTGYSSLSYLQRFDFSKVKIDRSFVASMEHGSANLAIIRAIIGLCRDLGIDVVAEGIETADQAELLRHENCRLLQGYFFGRPKPFAEVQADHAVSLLEGIHQTARTPALPGLEKRTVHKLL